MNAERGSMRCQAVAGRRQPGFTLIEMVVVLAIVGLLAAAAHPVLRLSAQRQQEMQLRSALRQLRTAIDAYAAAMDSGQLRRPTNAEPRAPIYPPSLEVLVEGAPLAEGPGRRIFLRRIPRDPFADPRLPAHSAWALRASDSPPDDPRAGRDVFDVASRSSRQALDGSHYRDW